MAKDPRIDAKIAEAAPFAQPILKHLRALVHATFPDTEETIKWGMPHFMVGGKNLAGMAAFKAHCAFVIHGQGRQGDAMGQYGKIASLSDLPDDAALAEKLRQASAESESGTGKKAAPRQAKPDLVISNLAGNQITNFIKQYAEFGLPYPIAGFGFDTAVAWGAGADNFAGTWPLIWHHDVDTPSSKAFVAAFKKKYGKPPENQAWGEYVALKAMVQAMGATKSTDSAKLIEYLEKGAQLDILKARKGYFREWDHQLMQEMYTATAKPKGKARDQWDFMALGQTVPGPKDSLEILAPTREENACTMST